MRVSEALIKGISTTESESDFEVFKFPVQREHTEFAWKGAITSPWSCQIKSSALKAMEMKKAQRYRNPGCTSQVRFLDYFFKCC